MDAPPEEIAAVGGERLATAIANMRRGEVTRHAGYDGEYGVIRLLDETRDQVQFFFDAETQSGRDAQRKSEEISPQDFSAVPLHLRASASESLPSVQADLFSLTRDDSATSPVRLSSRRSLATRPSPLLSSLNDDQRAAVTCTDRPLVIVAGPGTGKTRTLTVRIAHLIAGGLAAPEAVLAVTFTNKAATEMAARLAARLDPDIARRITVQTFHALGAALLREHAAAAGVTPAFVILDEEERRRLLRRTVPSLPATAVDAMLRLISAAKNRCPASQRCNN